MTKSKFSFRALGLAAGLAGSVLCMQSSIAATTSTTFTVNATVLSSCLLAATNLNFGNYSAVDASPNDATNTITATCNNGEDYTLALDAGVSPGATVAARAMVNGLDTLDYALYTTAARTTIWGDGTLGTATVSSVGTGLPQLFTVYGRVPDGQSVTAGLYADLITVTLTF